MSAPEIKTTPFPFPFVQLISLSLFVLTLTLPLVMNKYADTVGWCVFFTLIAEFGFFMLATVAAELELISLELRTCRHQRYLGLSVFLLVENPEP